MLCIYSIVFNPLPSTMILAIEFSVPIIVSMHCTVDWLFSDITLWIVMVAGLADGIVSGELTWGIEPASPALAVYSAVPSGTFKSNVQDTPPKLLLQVNVTLLPTGTTYPPGIGWASAVRLMVTAYKYYRDMSSYNCTISTYIYITLEASPKFYPYLHRILQNTVVI